jgi:hypothetical protein
MNRLIDQLDMKSAGSGHNHSVKTPGAQHGPKIGMNRYIRYG